MDRTYRMRWWTLGVLSLSLAIIGLDNTILNVAIPTLQQEFDASASTLQWMVDSYMLVFAGLLLMMGSLGDRFGRRRALQAGLTIFGVASVAAAYAQTGGQLIAFRAVMGIGGALIMPATLSIITDVFPREERGTAIGIWAAVAGLGIGLGPLIGGLLLESFWWGSVFFINLPIALTALLLAPVLVPESRDPDPAPVDFAGTVLSIAAVSALVYAVIEVPERGWTEPLILGSFAAAAALGAAFAWVEMRSTHPMLDLRFFRNLRFSIGSAAISITFFSLFGLIFGLTQYLQFVQGYTPLEAGARVAPIALGVLIGAGSSQRLVARLGTTRVVTAALVLLAAVVASIYWWEVDTTYAVVGTTVGLLAYGMGNVMAPATDAVMGAVPEEKAGVASAMNDVTRQVGGALGVAVIGSAMSSFYSERVSEAASALPPDAAEGARNSLGQALGIASTLPPEAAGALVSGARVAFTEAFGLSALIAMGAALLGAVVVRLFLPADHLPVAEELAAGVLEADELVLETVGVAGD